MTIDGNAVMAIASPPDVITDAPVSPGGDGLYAMARNANIARQRAVGDVGVFARSRRLLPSGAWRGPRDATDSFVEADDLPALFSSATTDAQPKIPGRMEDLRDAGVRLLLTSEIETARAAAAADLRVWWRLRYRRDRHHDRRNRQWKQLAELAAAGITVEAILPTPDDEPMGLDTLELFARCRVESGVQHIGADFAALGPRLAQMALTVGADLLFGPVVAERALRLGDNSRNPSMTRKEVAMLLRGAGLIPHERLAGGRLEEVLP